MRRAHLRWKECITAGAVLLALVMSAPVADAQSSDVALTSGVREEARKNSRPKPRPARVVRTDKRAAHAAGALSASNTARRSGPVQYYIDFRARTAASYGHAFVWYGRTDKREVEVAGLHPATDNVLPYLLGHLVPVPSETGRSYGDLDEEYLTARFRVLLNEEQAGKVFAYVKYLQANSPVWHAPTSNCITFIKAIADYIGLRTPMVLTTAPETWVSELQKANGGAEIFRLPTSQPRSDPATYTALTRRQD